MTGGDFRDVVIETLAASEAALQAQVASLEVDVQSYRELARQAIHALHGVTVQRDRLRAQHYRLLDEYRDFRAQTMRKAIAA